MILDSFECMKCSTCCRWKGYVRISEAEAEAISDFLGLSLEDFHRKYTDITKDRRSLTLLEKSDGACIFLNSDNGLCIINEVKPQQCSDFPGKWNFPGWEDICKGNKTFKPASEKS